MSQADILILKRIDNDNSNEGSRRLAGLWPDVQCFYRLLPVGANHREGVEMPGV